MAVSKVGLNRIRRKNGYRHKERKNFNYKRNRTLTPYWITYWGDKKLLFSSMLIFDGSNPKPHLILYLPNKEIVNIWTKNIEE